MKIITTLVLSCLIIVLNVSVSSIDGSMLVRTKRSISMVIKTPPINPRHILEKWKPLRFLRPHKSLVIITMGHPSIEWTKKSINKAFYQQIPEGAIAAAVDIAIMIDKNKKAVLNEFCFANKFGAVEYYIRSTSSDMFIRSPYMGQILI